MTGDRWITYLSYLSIILCNTFFVLYPPIYVWIVWIIKLITETDLIKIAYSTPARAALYSILYFAAMEGQVVQSILTPHIRARVLVPQL